MKKFHISSLLIVPSLLTSYNLKLKKFSVLQVLINKAMHSKYSHLHKPRASCIKNSKTRLENNGSLQIKCWYSIYKCMSTSIRCFFIEHKDLKLRNNRLISVTENPVNRLNNVTFEVDLANTIISSKIEEGWHCDFGGVLENPCCSHRKYV